MARVLLHFREKNFWPLVYNVIQCIFVFEAIPVSSRGVHDKAFLFSTILRPNYGQDPEVRKSTLISRCVFRRHSKKQILDESSCYKKISQVDRSCHEVQKIIGATVKKKVLYKGLNEVRLIRSTNWTVC